MQTVGVVAVGVPPLGGIEVTEDRLKPGLQQTVIETPRRTFLRSMALVINDAVTPAVGEITHLTGRILDAKGTPIACCHRQIQTVVVVLS